MAIVSDVMPDGDARRGVINNIKLVLLDLNFRAVHIRTKTPKHNGIKIEFILVCFLYRRVSLGHPRENPTTKPN